MSTVSVISPEEVLCPNVENRVYSKGLPWTLYVFNCSMHNFTGICISFSPKSQSPGIERVFREIFGSVATNWYLSGSFLVCSRASASVWFSQKLLLPLV